jgi:hypothetical protein
MMIRIYTTPRTAGIDMNVDVDETRGNQASRKVDGVACRAGRQVRRNPDDLVADDRDVELPVVFPGGVDDAPVL